MKKQASRLKPGRVESLSGGKARGRTREALKVMAEEGREEGGEEGDNALNKRQNKELCSSHHDTNEMPELLTVYFFGSLHKKATKLSPILTSPHARSQNEKFWPKAPYIETRQH